MLLIFKQKIRKLEDIIFIRIHIIGRVKSKIHRVRTTNLSAFLTCLATMIRPY